MSRPIYPHEMRNENPNVRINFKPIMLCDLDITKKEYSEEQARELMKNLFKECEKK